MCWQFERCFEQTCKPVISCAVPGPQGSDGTGGKLLQADQHNSVLVLLLNFYLSVLGGRVEQCFGGAPPQLLA